MLRIPFYKPSVGAEEIDEVVAALKSGWLTSQLNRIEAVLAKRNLDCLSTESLLVLAATVRAQLRRLTATPLLATIPKDLGGAVEATRRVKLNGAENENRYKNGTETFRNVRAGWVSQGEGAAALPQQRLGTKIGPVYWGEPVL